MKLLDKKIFLRHLKNAAELAVVVILSNVIRDWMRNGTVQAKDYLSVTILGFLAVLFVLAVIVAIISTWWRRKTGELD